MSKTTSCFTAACHEIGSHLLFAILWAVQSYCEVWTKSQHRWTPAERQSVSVILCTLSWRTCPIIRIISKLLSQCPWIFVGMTWAMNGLVDWNSWSYTIGRSNGSNHRANSVRVLQKRFKRTAGPVCQRAGVHCLQSETYGWAVVWLTPAGLLPRCKAISKLFITRVERDGQFSAATLHVREMLSCSQLNHVEMDVLRILLL